MRWAPIPAHFTHTFHLTAVTRAVASMEAVKQVKLKMCMTGQEVTGLVLTP